MHWLEYIITDSIKSLNSSYPSGVSAISAPSFSLGSPSNTTKKTGKSTPMGVGLFNFGILGQKVSVIITGSTGLGFIIPQPLAYNNIMLIKKIFNYITMSVLSV